MLLYVNIDTLVEGIYNRLMLENESGKNDYERE